MTTGDGKNDDFTRRYDAFGTLEQLCNEESVMLHTALSFLTKIGCFRSINIFDRRKSYDS